MAWHNEQQVEALQARVKHLEEMLKATDEDIEVRNDEIAKLRKVIQQIDQTLRVPAAEYVPAIGDVFTIIDRELPGLVKK